MKYKKKIIEESKDKYFTLNCQIFQDFTSGIGLEELVSNYNKQYHFGWDISIKNASRWVLSLPNKIFVD